MGLGIVVGADIAGYDYSSFSMLANQPAAANFNNTFSRGK